MKRIVFFLLLTALLLTACTSTTPPTEPSTQPTEATKVTEPTQTAGGVRVKTDYSAYAERSAVTPQYTRWSDEPLTDLQPSDEYGTLYPFPGVPQYDSYGAGYTDFYGYLYGMVDAEGRIAADPVYASVELLIDRNSLTRLPLWVLKKRGPVSEDGRSTDDFYALAAQDGSFVTDCIYRAVFCRDDRVIAVRGLDDSLSFDVFDLQGNLLLSSEDLEFSDRITDDTYSLTYGEGLLTVPLGTGEFYETDTYSQYYYHAAGTEIVELIFCYPLITSMDD